MKKILILIFLLFCFNINAKAQEINTCIRSEENLMVNKKYEINDSNKSNVLATPCVNANDKIYDYSNVLREDLKQNIEKFIKNYKMDMAIVTINENNNGNAKQFGQDFYDYNDFGINYDNYSGILLVIDFDVNANGGQKRIEIITTGEAIFYYSDNRIESILDSMMNNIYSQNYSDAVKDFINSASEYAESGIPSANKGLYFDANGEIKRKFMPDYFLYAFISGVISSFVIIVLYMKNKMILKNHPAREYIKNKNIKNNVDKFITTHTILISNPTSTGSGGGSSFGSGSSGGSHGGGGRSF